MSQATRVRNDALNILTSLASCLRGRSKDPPVDANRGVKPFKTGRLGS